MKEQAARTRHVLHNGRRCAGHVPRDVAREQARIEVIAAARAIADNDRQLLAAVEICDGIGVGGQDRDEKGGGGEQSLPHGLSP